MKILVTGAAGAVGYEVVKLLMKNKDGVNIVAFEINNANTKNTLQKHSNEIKIIYGDLRKQSDVESAVKGVDAVIHLGAIIPPAADELPDAAYEINYRGTVNIINAVSKYSPNAFLIYSSSISVYGDRVKNPHIKVGDPLIPSFGDEYAVTKISAEKAIQESSINWTIFRLTAIMGKHKISKLMFHMPLETMMQISTPQETAQAFVNALFHQGELNHKIFNLSGGSECIIKYDDFLKRNFQIFGLGELNFPEHSFAEHNFHCGIYDDGDDLEEILHFRSETIDTYLNKLKEDTPKLQTFFAKIFKGIIKKKLAKLSEPLQAFNTPGHKDRPRYFTQETINKMVK